MFWVIASLTLGCSQAAGKPDTPPPVPASVQPEEPMRFVLEAEAIVVATVVEVGEPPLHWSGFAAAYQTVQYTVDTQIKGDLSVESTISVRHPVVAGAPSADPARPGLSPTLFRLGNRLILLLSRDGEQLIVSHENVGARLYTPALEASIREALR